MAPVRDALFDSYSLFSAQLISLKRSGYILFEFHVTNRYCVHCEIVKKSKKKSYSFPNISIGNHQINHVYCANFQQQAFVFKVVS